MSFDTKVLSKFIYALNIARQHVGSYPDDHPLIAKSTGNVLKLLANLLEFQDHLSIGVFKDTLVVAEATLDPRNPVYRKLAKELFDLGIAALTFRRNFTRAELIRFLQLIQKGRDPNQDQQQLTLELRALQLEGLKIKLIDYGAFAATEEARLEKVDRREAQLGVSLWDRFIEGMIQGNIDPEGRNEISEEADPQLVAAFLNRHKQVGGQEGEASYEESITSFLRELDREDRASAFRTEALEKLSLFVDSLSPELRRQFLSSTFNTLEASTEIAEEVMNHLSSESLFEALEDVNAQRLTMPAAIMNLLGKLSQHAETQNELRAEETREALSSAELGEHLASLFQEDDPDRFVPGTYQHLLHTIVSAEEIEPLEGQETEELHDLLTDQSAEMQLCYIVLDLLRQDPDAEQRDSLAANLHELLMFFLEIGEFGFILDLQDKMRKAVKKGSKDELRSTLVQQEFLREVLSAMSAWGKDKFPAITELVKRIGPPFIEPLLDHLGSEKRMALRRFCMARLNEMGGAIREPVLNRLRDGRWFYVRNLIVLLRELNDPVTLHALRTMVRHPHPQVRLEVAKTLLQFRDPALNRYILDELASSERDRQKQGFAFAEKFCSAALLPGLLPQLEKTEYGEAAMELKFAAVRLLAKIGSAEALPSLESVLLAKSLIHGRALGRLKTTIINSLVHYPRREVKPILQLQIDNGGELGKLAAETLQRLYRRDA